MSLPKASAFTLAELLIALAILGVIATFTIPKVLQAQQNQAWKAIGKESAATISAAYQAYKANNTPNASTLATDITPYLNYIRIDSTTRHDSSLGNLFSDCATGTECYILHNGAILHPAWNNSFGVADSSHYVYYILDPDAKYSGTTNGPGKALLINLYFDGRISSPAYLRSGDITNQGGSPQVWSASPDPDWFSWN